MESGLRQKTAEHEKHRSASVTECDETFKVLILVCLYQVFLLAIPQVWEENDPCDALHRLLEGETGLLWSTHQGERKSKNGLNLFDISFL